MPGLVSLTKADNICRFLKVAPPGLVVEIGVYRGGFLQYVASRFPNRQFIGYDTFQGLPKPVKLDNHCKEGDFSDVNSKAVISRLQESCPNVTIVRGLYPNSDKGLGQQIALAHVDVDLYQSTYYSFRHLSPLMVPGGRIYCDDAFEKPCEGATFACCRFSIESNILLGLESGNHAYFEF